MSLWFDLEKYKNNICKSILFEYKEYNVLTNLNYEKDILYFVKNAIGLTKIGVTNDYESRIKTMEYASGQKMIPIFKFHIKDKSNIVPYMVEQFLLDYYKEKRIIGEWCDFNKKDLMIIYAAVSKLWNIKTTKRAKKIVIAA